MPMLNESNLDKKYLEASSYRESLPRLNQFDIAKLQKMPRFFNWVGCEALPGSPFKMYLAGGDDGVALRYFWNGHYEKFTLSIWSRLASQSKNLVVDIGAHTGVYSLAAQAVGSKTAVSFEPHCINFARLLLNLRGNDFETVNTFMLGCGEANSTDHLAVRTRLDYLSTGGKVGAQDGCINLPISIISLDNFIDIKNHAIDLLKIDVEGYEEKVLAGARLLIQAHKPVIFFECLSDKMGKFVENFLSRLHH